MQTGPYSRVRRVLLFVVVGFVAMSVTACTGRGGGQLPPAEPAFPGAASLGFSFSCQDSGGLNPPTGRLHIELSYGEKGTSPQFGAPFSIHGIVDEIDPVLESAICIGQNPPPGGNELIFLGRYYLTSTAPTGFPASCPTRETTTTPLCRFEVIVRDNDMNHAPSTGDYFRITLSNATASPVTPTDSQLDPDLVVYTRGGILSAGNLTVG